MKWEMQHDVLTFPCIPCCITYRDQPGTPQDWIGTSWKKKKFGSGCVPESARSYRVWIAFMCYGDLCDCIEGNSTESSLCDCIAESCGGSGIVVGNIERKDKQKYDYCNCVNFLGGDHF